MCHCSGLSSTSSGRNIGNGSAVPCILNLGTTWRWLNIFMSHGETARCPLYRRDFTVSTLQERLHGVHSTGETSRCPLYRRDFTVSNVQERLHGVHSTGETSRCPLYRRDFTVTPTKTLYVKNRIWRWWLDSAGSGSNEEYRWGFFEQLNDVLSSESTLFSGLM